MLQQALYDHLETGMSPTLGAWRVFANVCRDLSEPSLVFTLDGGHGGGAVRNDALTLRLFAADADPALTLCGAASALVEGKHAFGGYVALGVPDGDGLRWHDDIGRFEAFARFTLRCYER